MTKSHHTTSPACAACKYQRRKCAPNCLLAPFFPPDRTQDFLNAHKLFGISNISKTIRDLPFPLRRIAMWSIINHASIRANDPVGGCHRIIVELQRQICLSEKEFDCVRQLRAYYKSLSDNNFVVQTIVDDRTFSHAEEKSFVTHARELRKTTEHERLEIQVKPEFKQNILQAKEICSSSTKSQLCHLGDISEDVKPFLGEFYERDNTIIFDSDQKVMVKEKEKGEGKLKNIKESYQSSLLHCSSS